MLILCTNYKLNDKIICIKFPLILEEGIVFPFYLSNNLDFFSRFIECSSFIELEKGWFVFPIKENMKNKVVDFIKLLDEIPKENVNKALLNMFKPVEDKINIFYSDVGHYILFLFEKKIEKKVLNSIGQLLTLKEEDIFVLSKLLLTRQDLNLPYIVFHKPAFRIIIGSFFDYGYIVVVFEKMSSYISFINKIIK